MKAKALSFFLLLLLCMGLVSAACMNKNYQGVPVPLELTKTTFHEALDQFAYLDEYGGNRSSELDLRMIDNRLRTLFPGVEFACYASHQSSFGDSWDFYSREKSVGMSRILNPGKLGVIVICPGGDIGKDSRALITVAGDQSKVVAIIVPMLDPATKETLENNIDTIFEFTAKDYQEAGAQWRSG